MQQRVQQGLEDGARLPCLDLEKLRGENNSLREEQQRLKKVCCCLLYTSSTKRHKYKFISHVLRSDFFWLFSLQPPSDSTVDVYRPEVTCMCIRRWMSHTARCVYRYKYGSYRVLPPPAQNFPFSCILMM